MGGHLYVFWFSSFHMYLTCVLTDCNVPHSVTVQADTSFYDFRVGEAKLL